MDLAKAIRSSDPAQKADPGVAKIALVVDDDAVNRMILEGMLNNGGYEVVHADNGQEAIQKYIDHQPDVILMDIMMPVLNGYEATVKIKELAGDTFVPIIFLTAVTEEAELAKCVKVGGGHFLTKPYSRVILMAKIEALMKMSELYSTIRRQRDEIDVHNEHMLREQKVAKKIFSKIVHEGCLDLPIIKYMLSPLSVFNGDLLLAARTPSGGINILLGDATGHGLPAAIGAVPISDIFYDMTANGSSVVEIVLALNQKLKTILPPEFFFCASILNLSSDFRLLTIWHAGLPDVLIYSADNRQLLQTIRSNSFPLGVVDNKSMKTELNIVELQKGDRIYLYSDGITEARNADAEQFGSTRLLQCFDQNIEPDILFEHVIDQVTKFRGHQSQSDDLTLLEINADSDLVSVELPQESRSIVLPYPNDWGISMFLGPRDFRETNPVAILTKFVTQIEGLIQHKEHIFIILSELYNNALEHGILGLDSSVKSNPEGFAEYLLLRQERLSSLNDGSIILTLEHDSFKDCGELVIHIEDSGSGFDYHLMDSNLDDNRGYCGRGLSLVKSLCTSCNFYGEGNKVTAVYQWKNAS